MNFLTSPQTVMDLDGRFLSPISNHRSIWTNTLAVTPYATSLSAFILFIRLVWASKPLVSLRTRLSKNGNTPIEPADETTGVNISKYGGSVALTYKTIRALGCLFLLGLSLASLVAPEITTSTPVELEIGLCISYLYAFVLALKSIKVSTRWSRIAATHLNWILVLTFGVYFWRDLFPLGTYTWPIEDSSEGWLLHAKIATLFVVGLAVPILIPRPYIPVDAKNPMPIPSSEQTASLLSLSLFSYLDYIVVLANRSAHLSYDLLPPLADSDDAEHLKTISFPHLDEFTGGSRAHIFFGLIKVFRWDCLYLTFALGLFVAMSFVSPIGINRILHYLEHKGEGRDDSNVRPFVWIAWLLFGPAIGTIALGYYFRIAMRTLVRTEGIITQLVFEHALRSRVKADQPAGAVIGEGQASVQGAIQVSEDAGSTTSGDATLHSNDSGSDTSGGTQERPSSVTSKNRKDIQSPAPAAAAPTQSSMDVGKINNLVTTDLRNITKSSDFFVMLIHLPLQVIFCVVFLYAILGWSAFIGMATMLILFPVSGFAAKILQRIQKSRLKAADARVGTISETMNVLRMIKLFGWEKKMFKRVTDKREAELVWIWKREIFELLANTVNNVIPVVTMVATYTTYVSLLQTVFMKQELHASVVFSTMIAFDMLRNQLHMASYQLIQLVTSKVSMDRINDFLRNTELLDVFSESKETSEFMLHQSPGGSQNIGFQDATFTWSNDTDGSTTPSRHNFVLRIENELLFKRGCINLILGPTGAGKTSMLMALLGEMHFVPSMPTSSFNLPREAGVAYAAQESFVLNETIKDNILFGSEFDEVRYKKVIYQCCLERDLELFEAGDLSEVGEKGLTLSGGQKARVTLARAIYSRTEILLLDDVLAALDVHTAKWIVDKCFSGDLVRGRTVLLVTHNVALTSPIADFVVSIGLDGRVLSQGSVSDALKKDRVLAKEVYEDKEALKQHIDEVPKLDSNEPKSDGKLILAEEIQIGKVKWSAVGLYLRGLYGNYPILFFLAYVGGYFLCQLIVTGQTWYLGFWASQYENHPRSEVSVFHHLGVYTTFVVMGVAVRVFADTVYAYACLRASRTIHNQLAGSILGTTLRWLDVTPASRVIARFTEDITAVDGPILNVFAGLMDTTTTMVVQFGAVVLLTPLFFVPGVFAAAIGGIFGQTYITAMRSVKRENSNARAPVLGHFGAAIAGLTSIRAYGAQDRFIRESLKRINRYTRTARILNDMNRWISIRLNIIGNTLSAGLAAYLVYFQDESAANTGFSLSMAAGFSMRVLFWVRLWNEVQIQGNSLERIQDYINIEQEPKPTEAGKPPAYWPSSGDLRVEKLSARYSPDGPKVLHDISFNIKSGERVGIVGRTGSGKSSLTLALLRCIFTEGTVYYDGIPTSSVNLDELRSNITIIPQMPELISGTLRHNLDPFEQYDDATLNSSLRAAGLFSLQSEMEEGRLTLDSNISTGGNNLSVGQRQILALARAIVRESKLLILDEATSAIDYKTDTIIQSSLRHELKSDVTVITVAHRLQTILDSDKIMVLDEGRIVEFDSPKELLKNPNGKLRSLVDESGDREKLIAMADGTT